jgi:hypothetical protein
VKGTWRAGEEPDHTQTVLGAIALALILIAAWIYGDRPLTIHTTVTVTAPSASPPARR